MTNQPTIAFYWYGDPVRGLVAEWQPLFGWGAVAINGELLRDQFGNPRRFKTEAGARRAAAKVLKEHAQCIAS